MSAKIAFAITTAIVVPYTANAQPASFRGIEAPPGGGPTGWVAGFSAGGTRAIGGGCGGGYAFIWDEALGARDLHRELTDLYLVNMVEWTRQEATGISADGRTIVGTEINPDGNQESWIAFLGEPLPPPNPPGDMDCDGRVANFDIDPFVLALTTPSLCVQRCPDCDLALGGMDGDGFVDNLDIDPFVEAISGG